MEFKARSIIFEDFKTHILSVNAEEIILVSGEGHIKAGLGEGKSEVASE